MYGVTHLKAEGKQSTVQITPMCRQDFFLKKWQCKKFIDHLYLPTEVSNSRARIHTIVEHFSCSTQWTTVFLSEQLCSGATVEGCYRASQQWRKISAQSRLQKQTEAGLSSRQWKDARVECKQSAKILRTSSELQPHLNCVKTLPLRITL